MKFCRVSLFLALLAAVCLPAVAQTQMRLDIPFNFSAAGKSLPAGQYVVAKVFAGSQAAWRVSDYRGGVVLITSSIESWPKAHRPGVVFWCSGKTCSLRQIWLTENYGQELLLKSKVKTTILAEGGKSVEGGKYVEIAGE